MVPIGTLIYTPGIQVVVESSKATDPRTGRRASVAKPVLIDVSEDVIEFQMVRRSDGVSTFDFSLNNARRKYDNVFAPNDRMFVMMKRLTWLRTFTGYLNNVPVFAAWPGVVSLSSSCSLKRLQYFYWDSSLQASINLVRQHLTGGAQAGAQDGGLRNAAKALLASVVGWPEEKVHIGEIPSDWFEFAKEIAQDIVDDAAVANQVIQQIRAALGSDPSLAGAVDPASTAGSVTIEHKGSNGQDLPYCGVLNDTSGIATNFGSAGDAAITNNSMFYGDIVGRRTSRTNGDQFFCAIRLPFIDYTREQGGKRRQDIPDAIYPEVREWWHGRKLIVSNPATQKAVVVTVQDSGPALSYHGRDLSDRVIDLSLPALNALLADGKTGTAMTSIPKVNVAFVDASEKPGVVDASTIKAASSGTILNDPESTAFGNVGSSPAATKGKTDAHSFLQYALNLGATKIPYSQGGSRSDSLHSVAPKVVDCSSFIGNVFYHTTGLDVPGGCTVATIEAYCKLHGTAIRVSDALLTQGALLITHSPDNHIEMSIGDGKRTVGAHHTGTVTQIANAGNRFQYAYLMPNVDYTGAGPGHQTPVSIEGSTTTIFSDHFTRTTEVQVGGGGGFETTDLAADSPAESIDSIFGKLGSMGWNTTTDPTAIVRSESLVGLRALLNDEPIYGYIKSLMNSSMRSFCSAPNGDFIAWFPDYYGLWGTAAVMTIEPIELQNFTVSWSDDFFVTHQFVTSANASNLDPATGTLSSTLQGPDVTTVGVATIDIKAVMKALFGTETDAAYDDLVNTIYQRFGPRPDFQQMQGIYGPKGEFFMALFLFMRQWAYQYNANVEMTFMPELWPGMLLQIPAYSFQAYVATVTHTGRFGDGGGFTTVVNIASPARTDAGRDLFLGMPLSGTEVLNGQAKGRADDLKDNASKAANNQALVSAATQVGKNVSDAIKGLF